ncbi:Zinc-transporting ATPase [compost metagenome]
MEQAAGSDRTKPDLFSTFWEKYGSILITILCLFFIILAWFMGRNGWGAAEIAFYVLAYGIGGHRKAIEGLETLFKEKDLDVDLLMVVAAVGAASIGYWMDGAVLIFIFCLSGTLEDFTMEKTNQDIQSIMKLRPEEAVVLHGGKEQKVKVEKLQLGDVVLVRPGERIPTDGQVV